MHMLIAQNNCDLLWMLDILCAEMCNVLSLLPRKGFKKKKVGSLWPKTVLMMIQYFGETL